MDTALFESNTSIFHDGDDTDDYNGNQSDHEDDSSRSDGSKQLQLYMHLKRAKAFWK